MTRTKNNEKVNLLHPFFLTQSLIPQKEDMKISFGKRNSFL